MRDVDASIAFYEKYARMTVVDRRDQDAIHVAWLTDYTRPFIIVLIQTADPADTALGPLGHLGVACKSRAEVDRLCGESSEQVAEFTRAIAGVTNEAVLERVMAVPGPNFPVGTQYAYSNTGYVLLASIVAIVSGQSFAEFLKANVFDPLGMTHTVVYDASRPVLHKPAQGYIEEKGQFQRWDYLLLTAGDGGLFSTLDDLFLWDQALNTGRLVPQTALERAFTAGTTNDGTPVDYGFGWFTNVLPYLSAAECAQLLAFGGPGQRHVAHGGSLGHYNYIIRCLDTRRTIIVLTNYPSVPGPRVRAHRVADILFSHSAENLPTNPRAGK